MLGTPARSTAGGLAKLKTRDTAGGIRDISAANAIQIDIAEVYAGYGIK
jgi:hypothetical protein